MKKLYSILVVMLLAITTQAQTKLSHHQAVEKLLTSLRTDQVLSQSLDQMLTLQIKQNPTLQPYEEVMKAFFAKYMSWEALKEDLVQLYLSEFTEQEILDLTAFYQTNTGKKMAAKQPLLMAKGAELGQQKVQAHLPELQQMILQKMNEQKVDN